MPCLLRNCFYAVFLTSFLCLPSGSSAEPEANNGLIKEDYGSLRYSFPLADGWSFEKLARALLYAKEIGSSAVIVLHEGKLAAEWGSTTLKIQSHSVRKSLLSALCGIAVEKGFLDVDATLEEIGIDDRPPVLSRAEKQATVLDLLKSRSGIYHEVKQELKQVVKPVSGLEMERLVEMILEAKPDSPPY